MIFSMMVLPIAGLVNSAVEAIVDRISLGAHMLAGIAKDTGSAALLLSMVTCGAI